MSGILYAVPLTKQAFTPFGEVVVDRRSPGNNLEEVWFGERGISPLALE